MLLAVSIMTMSFGVTFSWWPWQEDACSGTISCKDLSNNFTVPYCVNSDVDYALDCVWPSLTNKLSSIRESSKNSAISFWNFEMRNVIEQYCKALLWNGNSGRIYFAKPNVENDSWDWQQTFDSHQSIFVYALCSSFKAEDEEDGDDMPFIESSEYSKEFLSKVFIDNAEKLVETLKLKQKSWWKDLCDLNKDSDTSDSDWDYTIQDCDMSIYATEIYSAIMSDIFKIKYAQVLNVDTTEDFNSEDKVVQFMSWYFDYFKKDFNELNADYPYKQTIGVLQSNQKYYKRVLDTVKIINNSELANLASKTRCPKNGNMVGADFIACALHSSQWVWSAATPSFVTLIYNEMLNYRIFEQYVNMWIKEKALVIQNKVAEKDLKRFSDKSLDLQWYVGLQYEATKHALNRFVDFNMTYPFHIWLLLYQEIMMDFRDKHLSPIITLFYSLSEKLQNVQLPN